MALHVHASGSTLNTYTSSISGGVARPCLRRTPERDAEGTFAEGPHLGGAVAVAMTATAAAVAVTAVAMTFVAFVMTPMAVLAHGATMRTFHHS